ncbi:TonB-dependent receptor [Sphingomonas faeni]|uniref:TonB-dependent receptor n=1 Tax=Sphingomonas faeni TaxID=185950 RepID=UPI002784817E|nr:TonB-dependent receptor [Sphingomonas faeni]MDQ0839287.1 iron complex outermembrane receptor protein [Sphingomonas faeni]
MARRFRVDLAFSNMMIGTVRAPAVSGTYRFEQAMAAALAGTGLTMQRVGVGRYIVTGERSKATTTTIDPPMPEIVVIGRKTQNVDIRRRASDIQPYQVITRRDVRNAHAATIEELLSKRMSADQRGVSFSQAPVGGQGTPQSSINLRGLGGDQTLVLLDGRRLPRLPSLQVRFIQSDVNALSVESIERAEVITSTAGGIYGPGAISGVVNLVLRRDYRGIEVTATRGITQRGDAPYGRLDARVGFTPDHGATDVMLAYSASVSAGLSVAERDYRARASERLFAQPAGAFFGSDLPISNSINVLGAAPLVLKQDYGGAVLGSRLTTLAPGGSRTPTVIGAELLNNAGRLDYLPASTVGGGRQSLTVAQRTTAILANVRHRFGGVQLYADLVYLLDRGQVALGGFSPTLRLSADDPRNPFLQPIDVSFPVPAYGTHGGQRIATARQSLGAIIDLPATWTANFDLSFGSAKQTLATSGLSYSATGYLMLTGSSARGTVQLDPFGDTTAFQDALGQLAAPATGMFEQTNLFSDATARFAGPVVTLPGGALVATMLLEQRRERVGPSVDRAELFNRVYLQPRRAFGERVRSAYIELRAPIFSEDARSGPLRGLELQLAARRDDTRASIGDDPFDNPTIAYRRFTAAKHGAMVFTAGFKIKPLQGLTMRASVASGENAPPISAVANAIVFGVANDPKRGSQLVGADAPYEFVVFRDDIRPERAQSLSAGFILTPFGTRGPSLSFDYTRIRRSREVNGSNIGNASFFLTNEALFPDRVTRLQLSPDDAAKGFTGGIVTKLDASYLRIGHTELDAVDVSMALPIRAAKGDLSLIASASWQPRYRSFVLPQYPILNYVNMAQGILEWRGNVGATWSKGPITLGTSGQYHGSYSVSPVSFVANDTDSRRQGARTIGAQFTMDLYTAYRIGLTPMARRPRTLDLRFGVQDLLDRPPATVVGSPAGYSYYSDPRRRRLELTAAVNL